MRSDDDESELLSPELELEFPEFEPEVHSLRYNGTGNRVEGIGLGLCIALTWREAE